MAEKKLGGLLGTPWHVGFITKKEDDPRRDKRRCLYYISSTKHCKINVFCNGSAHCKDYRDLAYENQQKKVKRSVESWKQESKFVRDPNIVQSMDDVRLFCYHDNKERQIHVAKEETDRIPLAKCCLLKTVGTIVTYNGYRYKIVRIIKNQGAV